MTEQAKRIATLIAAAAIVSACSHSSPPDQNQRSDGRQITAKPAISIGPPKTLRPGMNVWDNGDGTFGAVFVNGSRP
jgi:hypothetical protein